ncbi:glucohydrolase [Zobellella endophytica]|uniref:Alpha-amylase n=1 Tax=Zobellella endophytica TaxID=2116700 RepID=A0A2P7RBB5_9GAMM|nr:alpha-glucosidase [Zobellella endophytica]PSJ47536.1 glucohydrolase [Zobellella endophytica]
MSGQPLDPISRHWWKEAVAYQIYPRSFMDSNGDGIGDLNGIIIKLDYLQELGVDVIWLCPMYPSPNDDNGYDISDFQGIMAEFGTLADFDRLLAEVHARGMKLILDLVVNHSSDEHPWFLESRSSHDNPKRDWYIWRDGKHGAEPNNWESIFKGSAWEYDQNTGQYYLHLFSRKQPDLNWENHEVREAIYDMVRWWLDKGIDGFRLDAISHIKKEAGLSDVSAPEGQPYGAAWDKMMNVEGIIEHLDELCRETFNRYDIMTVGEANGVSPTQAEDWIGERHRRLNMIFAFDHVGLWADDAGAGLDLDRLRQAFGRWQTGVEDFGWNALFVENHDVPRIISRWGDNEHYWQQSATAIASLYFLMQGTPFIYQGQEIGMTNTVFGCIDDFNDVAAKNQYAQLKQQGMDEPDIIRTLSHTSRDNARTPMQWDAGPGAGFTTGRSWLSLNPNYETVNVAAQWRDSDSVLGFYRRLIRLRKAEPVLVYGRYRLELESDPQVYAYSRLLDGQHWLVLVNLSNRPAQRRQLPWPLNHERLALANYPVAPHPAGDTLDLRPFETRVYRLND